MSTTKVKEYFPTELTKFVAPKPWLLAKLKTKKNKHDERPVINRNIDLQKVAIYYPKERTKNKIFSIFFYTFILTYDKLEAFSVRSNL